MKKQMKRTVYEAPVTERFQVELEGSFCGSADVQNPGTIGIEDQSINTAFDSAVNNIAIEGEDGKFVAGSWD